MEHGTWRLIRNHNSDSFICAYIVNDALGHNCYSASGKYTVICDGWSWGVYYRFLGSGEDNNNIIIVVSSVLIYIYT